MKKIMTVSTYKELIRSHTNKQQSFFRDLPEVIMDEFYETRQKYWSCDDPCDSEEADMYLWISIDYLLEGGYLYDDLHPDDNNYKKIKEIYG
jgi:hypothetical protein